MEEKLSAEKVKQLMETEGEVRGLSLLEDKEYVLKKKGERGLKDVEQMINQAGYEFKFSGIERMKMYPLGLQAVILEAIQKSFNYNEKDFEEMGRNEAKVSPLIRIFMKHFVSLERMVNVISRMWRLYFSKGDLKLQEINRQKRYMVLRLDNWKLSPYNCQILQGYFATMLRMVVNKSTSGKEVKCRFRGDETHEFLLEWQEE
ncbi:MAG: hypothetical protein GF370_01935 [Candidatus Nealsonbacteria bacterium]|nr:hypothetical protein [Candidatus Nealsonbacteria bacterium]